MKTQVKKLVDQALVAYAGENVEFNYDISYPRPDLGDYATNAGLILAKKIPSLAELGAPTLAEKLAEAIKKLDTQGLFESISAVKGFINFRLSTQALKAGIDAIHEQGDRFGNSAIGSNKTVVVEYFQNNVAKPPHVGHLRSAVIGDSLARLLTKLSYNVISDTHIGDWGTQFGILLLAFKTMGNKAEVEKDPIQKLNELYVSMSAVTKDKPEEYEKAKAEFKKLEDGDPENRELWQWFVAESLKDFKRYCDLLQLRSFDYNLGESFYEDQMPHVLEEFEKKGLVKSGETGERYVDLEEYGLGRCILIKSDGATTYHMRDFATYIYRKTEFDFFKNVYVVDSRQSHHFKQLFKVLSLAGYPTDTDSVQAEFGFMSLPTGAISTRGGNTISLQALFEEAEKRSLDIINKKNPSLPDKEKVAKQVATAAIKYFDLSHNRKTDIEFSWDKAISFEGNAGPYLQYTHARIHGILSKAAESLPETREMSFEHVLPEELAVMRKLTQFPEILEFAAKDYLPNVICNYLFELAQTFNSFYESVSVVKESDVYKKNFRLYLIRAVAQVIKNGLDTLGIEAPEEM